MAIAVPAVVVTSIVIFGGFAAYDFQNDRTRLADRIEGMATNHGAVVRESLWHLNTASINLILDAVIADADVVGARVYDEFGSLVGARGDGATQVGLPTVSEVVTRETATGRQQIGRLEITYSDARLVDEARQQAWIIAVLAVLLTVATATAATLANWRVIGMPLQRLLLAIESTGRENPPQPVAWEADDEAGHVVRAFNDMRLRQYEAERSLIEIQRELEERVEQRTRELRRARDEAEAASRAKSGFLRSMSHELRTPLNAILGFSDLIKSPELTTDLERSRDYANDINRSARFLLDLVNDLLDISRLETETYVVEEALFPVDDLVAESVAIVRGTAAQKQIDVAIESTLPGVSCRGDRRMLKQALLNVLGNAVKFTDADGDIWIASRQSDDGGSLQVSITDTGRGIAERDMESLFDAFSRIEDPFIRTEQGAGLGLPLTRFLVERHDGVIGVESKVGIGTTVTIRIPGSRIKWAVADTDAR